MSWSRSGLGLAAALSGLSVLVGASLSGCAKKPAAPPPQGPPQVGVLTLREEPVTLTTELPGRTAAYLTSDVRPQVNGIVKARLFAEGADVRAGQVLYQIDAAPYKATFDQAKATLASAQANLVTLKLKADRYADLVKINAVARQDYDDAHAAYLQGAATVQQDQASLESARINLNYTRVTAPISGRIGRSTITPGALVTASQTTALATISTLDPIYVDATQSSDEVLKLKRALAGGGLSSAGDQSARVKLVLSDGTPYGPEGRLRFAEVQVDQTTGSVTLRAVFPNPGRVLLPGMFVREIVTQAVDQSGILVPQPAVTHNEKGDSTAMVVGAGDKAELRVIKADRAIGDKWLVTSGLKPGDRVIVDGLIKVQKPGQPVKPVDIAAHPASAPASGPPPGGVAPDGAPAPAAH